MNLKVYGSRASMPFFSRDGVRFGGNTSCYKLEMNGRTIIFDCGTGLMQFHADILKENPEPKGLKFDILLSHLHLDHIIGLSMFDFAFEETNDIRIYARSRADNMELPAQIFGIFQPPYWPVNISDMNCAKVHGITGNDEFDLSDEIHVKTFDSIHTNDTTGFRVEGEKTVVYLLDFEINDAGHPRLPDLADFCRNADVVVFDTTYLPEDYTARRGWGHSTFEAGILLAEHSRCKHMIFSHFSQVYSDDKLDYIVEKTKDSNKIKYLAAYDGMELSL